MFWHSKERWTTVVQITTTRCDTWRNPWAVRKPYLRPVIYYSQKNPNIGKYTSYDKLKVTVDLKDNQVTKIYKLGQMLRHRFCFSIRWTMPFITPTDLEHWLLQIRYLPRQIRPKPQWHFTQLIWGLSGRKIISNHATCSTSYPITLQTDSSHPGSDASVKVWGKWRIFMWIGQGIWYITFQPPNSESSE